MIIRTHQGACARKTRAGHSDGDGWLCPEHSGEVSKYVDSESAKVSPGRPGPGRQNIGQQRYETALCARELLYLGMAGPDGRVCVCVGGKLGALMRKNKTKHKNRQDRDAYMPLVNTSFAGLHRF